ncbi:hypothetical protein AMTR_s00128p00115590 [Amborella trichopoda]|uniref:Retrotransposon gag domain-containing protein n=1 Tax=Amborella trichopoda TaxID=13333 RepID=W1NQ03_AMBTC|nr:hypothetical protein AMTR_s00128p00115590 [Amborella trichopoda]
MLEQQRVKVPEPKPFSGARVAKELQNFLWDMEQYFTIARAHEEKHVTVTSTYLTRDAKLWWKTRMTDGSRPPIVGWEDLKRELKEQFLPGNTVWMAGEALRKLKHTATMREYVKQFSSLMLEIKNMSEEEKLFNFMAGLQRWAKAELRRQGVKDLLAAVTAAETLVDYKTQCPIRGFTTRPREIKGKEH